MLDLFPASWEGASAPGFQTIKTKGATAALAHLFLPAFLRIQGLMGHKVILFCNLPPPTPQLP